MEDYFFAYPWLFPAFIAFAWLFVLSLIARVGGWAELADHYPADSDYEGQALRFQSVTLQRFRFLPMGLNNIVTIGADPNALKLSVFVFFRPFHPPLSIPFSEIETASAQFFLMPRIEIATRRAPGVKILLTPQQAAFVATSSSGQFRVDPALAAPASSASAAASLASLLLPTAQKLPRRERHER